MRSALLAILLLAPQEPKVPTLALGAAAPDFDLPGSDGKRHRLSDFASQKLLLVVFDTVHCPTSQNYGERLHRIHADYTPKGVGMIAISPSSPRGVRPDEYGYTDLDDSFESMKFRVKDKGIPYPFCYDGEPNAVSKAYGPKATPHAFVFDADRKLRYQGGVDDNEWTLLMKTSHLRNALDALLEGKEPPVAETRAFGCSTKWPEKAPSVDAYNARIAAEPVTVEEATSEDLAGLLKADGKVKLVHLWTTSASSSLQACITMFHWYRRRGFEFIPVAVEPAEKKAAVLAALQGHPPAGKNRNLMALDAKSLDPAWDGKGSLTLVIGPKGDVLYRAGADFDELACKRAIVRNLEEDRMPKAKK